MPDTHNGLLTKPEGPPGAHFESMGVTPEVLQKVMSAALSTGGEDCDLYFQHAASTSVHLSDQKVAQASTHVDLGMGVRVVVGDQVGFAFSEDLDPTALIAAAKAAAQIANSNPSTHTHPLKPFGIPNRYPVTRPWEEVDLAHRVNMVREWEAKAFGLDSRVKRVEAQLADAATVVMIVRPDGRVVEDWRPMSMGRLQCTSADGSVRDSGMSAVAGRAGLEYFNEERSQRFITEAVDRSIFLLSAVAPPAGEMPVVLAAGPSAILLHEAIGHGMEADFNRKRTSIYADKMNKRIACPHVTVVDDGTIPGSRGALNIDDEGNPTERTVLVEDGILRSYLHDEISSRHYGVTPTGSGRRQGFRYAPMPRMRATFMENGPHSADEIIQSVEKGLYCLSFSNGQVNIGGGDFAFYMRQGFLIENGKLTQPVKDVNIIGNGPDALADIDLVANDAVLDEGGWTCGKEGQSVPVTQGMPTVRVAKLVVGGVNQ